MVENLLIFQKPSK